MKLKNAILTILIGIEEQYNYRNNVAGIAKLIDNGGLIDDILKYITPYFCIDRDATSNEPIIADNQMVCFIDKDEDDNIARYFVDE